MTDILITSSVLILALLVIRQVFKKVLSRRLQYALWGLVLVRLLVPVNLPAADFSVLTAAEPIQVTVDQRLEQVVRPSRPETGVPAIPPAQWPLDHVEPEVPPPQWDRTIYPGTYYPSPADHPKSGMTAGEALALAWKVGMALMGGFFLLSNLVFWLRLRRRRQNWDAAPYGVTRKVYLVEEGAIPSPCLFGSAIYLTPAALRSEESIRHVLTHEETHAKHLDPLWSLLRCVCLTVYWFDPLVWAASACAKTDCELACDEAVLKKLGEAQRIPYGQTLLSLIPVKRVANPLLTATTMTAGKRQLKDRITRIAQKPRQPVIAVVAVTVLALAISACTFTGGEPVPDPSPTPTESLEPSPTPAASPVPTESQEPSPAAPSILEYDFELVGVPGDDMYHVLTDGNGNTSFELTAETFVTLRGTWSPSSADLQVRLELEDGSPVSEVTLANGDISTVTIPTTGRYQLKAATGPDELDSGTLVLNGVPAGMVRAISSDGIILAWRSGLTLTKADGTVYAWGSGKREPAPELEWPEDFPSSMYRSIQIIENESYYAYLGCVSGLPHGNTEYHISVVYKDGREQWQYLDHDKTIKGNRIHAPRYRYIAFGEEPHRLVAYGKSGEILVEFDLETQEILWQYEIDEDSLPDMPIH